MSKRVLLYFFPLYLSIAEFFLRGFMVNNLGGSAVEPFSSVGPSIVAAGMVLMFPVLVPKPPKKYPLAPDVQAAFSQGDFALYSKADLELVTYGWIYLVVVLTSFWIATLHLALTNSTLEVNIFPVYVIFKAPLTLVYGFMTYTASALFNELKERF